MPETFDWITYGLRDDAGVLRSSERRDHRKDREHESKVADAVGDESFA